MDTLRESNPCKRFAIFCGAAVAGVLASALTVALFALPFVVVFWAFERMSGH